MCRKTDTPNPQQLAAGCTWQYKYTYKNKHLSGQYHIFLIIIGKTEQINLYIKHNTVTLAERHDLVLCFLTRISARKMMTNGWITFSLFIVASQSQKHSACWWRPHFGIALNLWLTTTHSNRLLEWRQDFTYNTYLLNIYQTKSTATKSKSFII